MPSNGQHRSSRENKPDRQTIFEKFSGTAFLGNALRLSCFLTCNGNGFVSDGLSVLELEKVKVQIMVSPAAWQQNRSFGFCFVQANAWVAQEGDDRILEQFAMTCTH